MFWWFFSLKMLDPIRRQRFSVFPLREIPVSWLWHFTQEMFIMKALITTCHLITPYWETPLIPPSFFSYDIMYEKCFTNGYMSPRWHLGFYFHNRHQSTDCGWHFTYCLKDDLICVSLLEYKLLEVRPSTFCSQYHPYSLSQGLIQFFERK